MAISAWISNKEAGAGQVLQGRDLEVLGLETALSCSTIAPGTNLGGVAENDLNRHLNTFHAAVDTAIGAALSAEMSYKGAFDASAANANALFPSKIGDMYTVDTAGNAGGFFTTALEVGDVIIAEVVRANQGASTVADWTVLEQNLSNIQSQITANLATQANLDDAHENAAGWSGAGAYIAGTGVYLAAATDNLVADQRMSDGIVANDAELAALHQRFPIASKGRVHKTGSAYLVDFTDVGAPELRMTVVGNDVALVAQKKA